MFAYLVKRLISGVLVLTLVSMAIFLLFWFGPYEPGQDDLRQRDQQPLHARAPRDLRAHLGFNNPVYEEYGKFVKGVFAGRATIVASTTVYECDAPRASASPTGPRQPVNEELVARMPATFSVAIGGAFLYLLFGIPIGVAAARRRGTVADKALVSSFLVISSIPYYLFALLTWLYLTVSCGDTRCSATPATSPRSPRTHAKWFSGMFLAWMALGIFGCTQYTRYTRGCDGRGAQ